MGDWQTYRLEDFIPFTPDVYWRLLERVNETFWPVHVLTVALGLTALMLALRGQTRMALALLAPAWLGSGILFHLNYYAELNWAAPWFGWAFITQAALMPALALLARSGRTHRHIDRSSIWIGTIIAMLALLAYPLLAAIIGPGWTHAETYGLHPDPTVITTLGVLLIVLRGPAFWLAFLIPVLWCVVGSLTLIAIEAPWALTPLAAATVVATTSIVQAFRTTRITDSREHRHL